MEEQKTIKQLAEEINDLKRRISSFNEERIKQMTEASAKKREQISKFHYSNKEQVERMSVFNKALEFVLLEFEKGLINPEEWEKCFEKWYRRLMLKMIEKEVGYKGEYFEIRKQKTEQNGEKGLLNN